MDTDLQKLRINKEHKAKRSQGSSLPWIIILILLLGGGAAAFYQVRFAHAATPVETMRVRMPEATPANTAGTAESQSGDLVILNATGYIIAAHKIEVASKVIGRVAWVGAEMGDKVEKGQVLVKLEDTEYAARVTQAKGQLDNSKARLAELQAGSRPQEIASAAAQLEQAKIDLETAQRNFKRLNEIRNTRSIAQPEIDDAESMIKTRTQQVEGMTQQLDMIKAGPRKEEIDAQAATVSQLEGNLAMATDDLNNTIIRAPITSTILERNVEVGEFVTNGFVGDRGAKGYVVSIADMNDLLVELDISQNDFAKVSQDQPCWITTDAYPDRKYNGSVERISPLANRQKATILVRVRVLKPDALLRPDMNATVSFLSQAKPAGTSATQAATPLLRIPPSALRAGAVFVVEDGKAVRRQVTPGMTAVNGDIEIRKGLIGGEDLILNPPEKLQDGDKVVTQKTP
jgi:HlyD family secretion protein